MSLTADTIDRLKAQLLTSNLSQRNHTLYQVINQLIDALRQGLNEIETQVAAITPAPSPAPSSPIINTGMPLSLDYCCDDGGEMGPPGIQGLQGLQGIQGIPGIDGLDGEDGLDGLPGIPGSPGSAGAAGANGMQGLMGPPGLDAEEPEEPLMIQGPIGPQGPAGGGGGSATTVEVNLAATATWRGSFTITDAAILGTSKLLVWQAPGPYTGKGTRADEAELQPVSIIAANPSVGSALVYWQTPPYLTDKRLPMEQFLTSGTTVLNSPKDPQGVSRSVATRLGLVRGNVKFTYMVM
jgi:hypothetical protein